MGAGEGGGDKCVAGMFSPTPAYEGVELTITLSDIPLAFFVERHRWK